jgi:hypothetical protein
MGENWYQDLFLELVQSKRFGPRAILNLRYCAIPVLVMKLAANHSKLYPASRTPPVRLPYRLLSIPQFAREHSTSHLLSLFYHVEVTVKATKTVLPRGS